MVWETGASNVISSEPPNNVNGYAHAVTPTMTWRFSPITMVEGIRIFEYCFCADDGLVHTVHMKAYFISGALLPSVVSQLKDNEVPQE